MKTLKFARNYNHKLDNPIFTTIRSVWDDPSRYIGDHYVVQYAYPGRPMSGRNGMGEKDGDVRPERTGRLHHS